MPAPDPDNAAIFHGARGIPDLDRRREYVRNACSGDETRIAQIEALLAVADTPDSLLDRPVGRELPATIAQPAEQPGGVIGPYKLLESIGEGGMGTVWMAQQTEPVKRLVALKLIKAGMDSRQVVARFEAERQALALMDHPNIARVLDGGSTTAGRPYFVMDLVKGVPITQYSDEHHLTPRQRLELFVPVCQALQHAHQKGVIHRDLKPSNVLVALYDGRPVPKVIDFGVAKAAGQPLTDKTLVTGFGGIVGTLEYMSPEQATLNNLDIDTRSDIYSLGVLLYELLAGSPPFSRKDLERGGMLEMLRVIREQEPSKPSTKLSTADGLPTLAANRGMEPGKLTRLVRGEVDWIVMKALEKDRGRRYETANGFAMDIQRYLADEPVQASPPSPGYRARKFARRNRRGLTVTAALALGALVGIGGIGWSVRDRAAMQAKVAQDFDRAVDRAESFEGQGKRADALAALDRAEALDGELSHDPARVARLAALKERLDAEARDLAFVAEYEAIRLRAASQVDEVQGRFRHEAVGPELRDALRRHGIPIAQVPPERVAVHLRSRPASVQQELIAALDECLRLSTPGDTSTRQWLLVVLAAADNDAWRARVRHAMSAQDWQPLEPLVRETKEQSHSPSFLLGVANGLPEQMLATKLDLLRRTQRAYPADVWANHWLGFALYTRHGRAAEALRYLTAAVALRPDSPGHYVNRGNAFLAVKEWDSAIADFQRALVLAPRYGKAHFNLGLALQNKGQLDEAITEYREAIKLDPKDDRAHYNLGLVLKRKERVDEAIHEFREALRIKPDKAEAHCELGMCLRQQGEFREALASLCRGHELGSKDPSWHYDSAQWVRQCERLFELDQRLPDVLSGKATPTSPAELIELAGLCSLKRLYRAASGLYEQALASRPELAEDQRLNVRHKAARAAALAGCGQGKDVGELDREVLARLRRQALIWLRADFAAWRRLPDKEPERSSAATRAIAHWQQCFACRDFAGVLGAEALSKLPEEERQPWQQFWSEMSRTRAQFQGEFASKK